MSLTVLQSECSSCRQCAHGLTRKQAVFAKGDPLSRLVFVGEAPGADEDERGQPFRGAAGRLLDKQIAAMRDYANQLGIAFPKDPYVCNVLKCRPPENKLLKDGSDIEACTPFLWEQLELLPNVKAIVALGKTAAIALGGFTDKSIPKAKMMTMEWLRTHSHAEPIGMQPAKWPLIERHIRVWPTYHPAYLLRKPLDSKLQLEAWADLKRVVEVLR